MAKRKHSDPVASVSADRFAPVLWSFATFVTAVVVGIAILFSWRCDPGGQRAEFESAIAAFRAANLDGFAQPAAGPPFYTREPLDPVWDAADPRIIKIPPFQLTNQSGQRIDQTVLEGPGRHPVVAGLHARSD